MEKPATASAIITFAEKLEDDSSKFYRSLAEEYPEGKETFLAFAKESEKNKVQVTRTYQETITDALEACFSFEDLKLNDYTTEIDLKEIKSCSDALAKAIELEDKATKFYSDAAELCKSLLATIPVALRKVAERRNNRKRVLKALLNKAMAQR